MLRRQAFSFPASSGQAQLVPAKGALILPRGPRYTPHDSLIRPAIYAERLAIVANSNPFNCSWCHHGPCYSNAISKQETCPSFACLDPKRTTLSIVAVDFGPGI
jgi:hypothetical protein